MKKTYLVSTVLCLSLMVAGCAGKPQPALTSEEVTSNTTVVSSEVTIEIETDTEVLTEEHQVNVEVETLKSIEIAGWEMTSIVPKVFVDGKEATELNASLGETLLEKYPLEEAGEYVDGWSTELSSWGVKENVLSIVIFASDTGTDYSTYEVFNYDLDTLTDLESSEVTKRLGMTDDELFDKTTNVVTNFCEERGYNLDKSLALINYDNLTPFVMEDGTPGVLASVVHPDDSQFSGSDSKCPFSLTITE